MATAGSGDVLSGLIGALLAGGLSPRLAAQAGAWVHGAAAEALEPRLGDAGLLAHEIADALPGVRRALLGRPANLAIARSVVTRSESETEAFGEALAPSLSPGDVVYLAGDLGAGKTALARGIARGLGAQWREVASPTFALVHEYAGIGGGIVLRHLDLYRLRDEVRELEALGLPESVAGAPVCVEWPGLAIRQALPPTIEIRLDALADDSRRIRCDRMSPEPAARR